ncbi:hypothetical protein HDG34_003203 [Paraburkholderia sp. HC6.4b]|uniref:hypothetical protein n=1 Tax=unclassified Paraburkholderia TaxID=2615204 RepID=UPI001616874F|nr:MULTISPECIES: hypothetical protein [unclassified Paraburkholderia]MBB5409262.1 hypothetical protein [Paraburkholderia sp. HC6.4b]MBB5450990.1 hypothetical protein [Paraburkholderia sp. Kb1A]
MDSESLDVDGNPLYVNARCTIVSVWHQAFSGYIGKKVVVAKLRGESAWIYNDQPIRYRTNRKGRDVVDHDPKTIQTVIGVAHLRLRINE